MAKLKRDATFWVVASQATLVNFFLGGFGPAQPLLREEQRTSLTVAGLHGTMMGIGSIIAGAVQAQLVHKYGRKFAAWIGLTLFTVGVPVFSFGNSVAITLTATLLLSTGISIVINNMVTQLSHHFSNTPDLAVSQSSAINSVGYVIGTLVVGSLATYNISWRIGLLIVVPLGIALYIFGNKLVIEERDHDAPKQSGKLSRLYWIGWLGFFASVASEFSTTFWAAALIMNRTGATAAISTLCITAVGSGMGIGRWYVPVVLKNLILDNRIKTILVTQFFAFWLLWFSKNLALSLVALFIVGIGISTQFSMTTVRLIRFSDNRPDLSMGTASYGAGLAIAFAPFFLAFLGDHIGISRAYLMVPVLISISFAALVFANSEAPQQR